MEKLQGLQYSREDGPTVQLWPTHEQEFFPGHSMSNVYQGNVADRSASAAEHDLPFSLNSFSQLEGSNEGGNWANTWTWDSFSLTAQPVSNGINLHKGPQSFEGAESDSPSPPDKLEADGEPTLLEFGLSTRVTEASDEHGLLDLKLGGNGHCWENDELSPNTKRSRHSLPENQQTRCQVDTCTADLHYGRDYHRRHKVCEPHAKARKALVGGVMQRFCQQCSRFHLLKEFDNDRRSCRKRLAGHNRRRRKTQPDSSAALASLLADQSVLSRIIPPAWPQQGKDALDKLLHEHALIQTLLNARAAAENAADNKSSATDAGAQSSLLNVLAKSQLLGNLLLPNSARVCDVPAAAAPAPAPAPADALITALSTALLSTLPHLLQKSNGDVGLGGSFPVQGTGQLPEPHVDPSVTQHVQPRFSIGEQPALLNLPNSVERPPLPTTPPVYSDKSIDSNGDPVDERRYSDSLQRGTRDISAQEDKRPLTNGSKGNHEGSGMCSVGHFQSTGVAQIRRPRCVIPDSSSPPMGDHLVGSAGRSDQSSDSSCDRHLHPSKDQTYQLWFKIFDKGPADFPPLLREEMLNWLNHLPDLEGHIRPGCIILSVFVCMPALMWDKLCRDIKKSLEKLVSMSEGDFWRKGRVLVNLGDKTAFILDGVVYPNTQPKSMLAPKLVLVQPFSVVVGEDVDLILRGYSLRAHGTKAICAYDGNCAEKKLALPTLGLETKRYRDEVSGLVIGTHDGQEEEVVTFNIGPFDSIGRGFIEVEGPSFSGNAFPIIIADRSICEDLSSLEREYVNRLESKMASQADIIHFLNELGWLLQRNKWKARHVDLKLQEFSVARYTWLLRFSVENGCRAVVKKVLDLLLSSGHNAPGHLDRTAMDILSEINLLHVAVKSNSPAMVAFLLTYAPSSATTAAASPQQEVLFRPDTPISDGFTCLHVAASMHSADGVVDALTNAPDELWATAWVSARDSFGKTPLMHALASGNYGYVKMVQGKLQKVGGGNGSEAHAKMAPHLALHIDGNETKVSSSSPRKLLLAKQIEQCTCKGRELLVAQSLPLRVRSLNMYRPLMMMMLAAAAVCVCVGVLMKSPPRVSFVKGPFVWESIGFGSI